MSNGVRCIAGALARVAAGDATTSGLFGTRLLAGASTSGSTSYAQAWFRDTAGGGAQIDLSDAIATTFTP